LELKPASTEAVMLEIAEEREREQRRMLSEGAIEVEAGR
jgi:hypothetical protein